MLSYAKMCIHRKKDNVAKKDILKYSYGFLHSHEHKHKLRELVWQLKWCSCKPVFAGHGADEQQITVLEV